MRLDVERAIEELVISAEQRGCRVHGVWIFGSCARGEAGPESDIDLGRLALERDELRLEAFLRATRYAAEDETQRNRMIVLAQAPHIGPLSS